MRPVSRSRTVVDRSSGKLQFAVAQAFCAGRPDRIGLRQIVSEAPQGQHEHFGFSRTAPTFPPPANAVEPGGGCGIPNSPRIGAYPGHGQFGPDRSPQHAADPSTVFSGFPSSKVTTTSIFPLLYRLLYSVRRTR